MKIYESLQENLQTNEYTAVDIKNANGKYVVLKSKSGYCKYLSISTLQFFEIVNLFAEKDINVTKEVLKKEVYYTINLK